MVRLRIVRLCLTLCLLVSYATAFPLTGGNGQVNVKILGTFEMGDVLYVDFISNKAIDEITLVDSEDNFYPSGKGFFRPGGGYEGNYPRSMAGVEVPNNVEIKRIRITPSEGDPFSIEWTNESKNVGEEGQGGAIPKSQESCNTTELEAKGIPIDMKFYGIQAIDNYNAEKTWKIDTKITNNRSQKQTIKNYEFGVIDQFGFLYSVGVTQLNRRRIIIFRIATQMMMILLIYDCYCQLYFDRSAM